MKKTGFSILLLTAALAWLALPGCSDTTIPVTPQDNTNDLGEVLMEGSFDPGAGTFVLKTLDVPNPDGPPVRLALIGSDLTTDPETETVEIMVSVRSLHPDPLYPPMLIWLSRMQPAEVTVLNADVLLPIYDPEGNPTGDSIFGFDYSELMGEDGILSPEETTGAKLWRFSSPGLQSFGFAARAEFGMAPDLPGLGGLCWMDNDGDGVKDEDEGPLPLGLVRVRTPGGELTEAQVRDNGRYRVPVTEAGLYTVFYDPQIETYAPIRFSTPNPREVVIVANGDGELQSFFHADFGVVNAEDPWDPEEPQPVQFTDLPADSLHYEFWHLEHARLLPHDRLKVEVGFSGCQPHHPFTLWASGGFMESDPVQVNLVLVHDLAEDCDMAFEQEMKFSLVPLARQYLEAYGPGVLQLNLIDFEGEVHEIEWEIYPPD